jgi:hypothetical protein
MKFFDPALNLSTSQKILRIVIVAFVMIMLHASLLAIVTGFAPAEAVKLPLIVISISITLILIYLSVSNYKKYHKIMAYNSYSGKSKGEIIWMAIACGLAFSLVFYASLAITFSSIFTGYFGKPYNAVDIVNKIEECRGRGCGCTYQLVLKQHKQGAFGEFCLSDSEWASLKAGNKVLVIGRSSFLGVSLDSFQLIK